MNIFEDFKDIKNTYFELCVALNATETEEYMV